MYITCFIARNSIRVLIRVCNSFH